MKYRIILILILSLSARHVINGQIVVNKSDVDYSLIFKQDSISRVLTFWKEKDSTVYNTVKYVISDFSSSPEKKNLDTEVLFIEKLWAIAEDSIPFDLKSFNIGYPLNFSDVLSKQIEVFTNSINWQNHIKNNGKTLDYSLIQKVMFENEVYKPLHEFLRSKGYKLLKIETEKHGFAPKQLLKDNGLQESEVIPLPFIVWIVIEK